MVKDARVRLFSFKRMLGSVVLGVLVLSGYIFGLYLIDHSGHRPPTFMLAIIGWPIWIWIRFVGRLTLENRLNSVIFLLFCNLTLYAIIIYLALLAISMVRRQPKLSDSAPPQPEQFRFEPPTPGDAA